MENGHIGGASGSSVQVEMEGHSGELYQTWQIDEELAQDKKE